MAMTARRWKIHELFNPLLGLFFISPLFGLFLIDMDGVVERCVSDMVFLFRVKVVAKLRILVRINHMLRQIFVKNI